MPFKKEFVENKFNIQVQIFSIYLYFNDRVNEYHYEFNIMLYTLRHPKAHDAGICCMRLEKDHENNQW